MANYKYHYFGAYLEITVTRVKREYVARKCGNDHAGSGPFCNKCGLPVSDVILTREEYPTHIVPDLLPVQYEDVFADITPPQVFNSGTILVRDNMLSIPDMWLRLSPWSEETNPPVLPFPTGDEISAMMFALTFAHTELIELIKQHPAVLSVEAKCGYVYCPEY